MKTSNWTDKLKRDAIKSYMDRMAEDLANNISAIEESCKSPIELALGIAMIAHDWTVFQPVGAPKVIFGKDEDHTRGSDYNPFSSNASIWPQMPIGRYTVDFGVVHLGIQIVVECDGHDFHERTKEQAAHDRARDRALQSAGWMVARFTGSEIYKDAASCVKQIIDMAHDEFFRRGTERRAS